MTVPPLFVGCAPKEFLKGRATIAFESDQGARLEYGARLADKSWEAMPGFQPHEDNVRVASEIACAIETQLGRRA